MGEIIITPEAIQAIADIMGKPVDTVSQNVSKLKDELNDKFLKLAKEISESRVYLQNKYGEIIALVDKYELNVIEARREVNATIKEMAAIEERVDAKIQGCLNGEPLRIDHEFNKRKPRMSWKQVFATMTLITAIAAIQWGYTAFTLSSIGEHVSTIAKQLYDHVNKK